ncbi:adenosylcobalamin-dependent ribonucleoside-diphosphate reductase [Candidatus Woesearchaeota archaeon]|nr:MAG: adenosylcobalamin-dependent ribonucleoside-diphosphate reductase [Candidatus Woesearchaeota archaeon]
MVDNKIKKIRKRNNEIVPFEQEKITNAIFKAAEAVGGRDEATAKRLSDLVVAELNKVYDEKHIPSVEEIQDTVEKTLIEEGHAKTAKAYIIYRQERRRIREEQKKILNGRKTSLPFSINALKVLAKRYLQKDDEGNIIEIPEEMFMRVAKTLAEAEKKYGMKDSEIKALTQQFYEVMANFEFVPAGRTLTNAGAPTPLVSNCIVLHAEDSMEGIFTTLKDASLLQQAGSGLGFPFHLLRPAGFRCKRSQGFASGPVSFLNVYNEAFGVIKQQNRHGANMCIMRVDHPDILEFIHCKDKEGDLRNFNISVGLTNEFMEKVKNNDPEPWLCTWNGKKYKPRRIYRKEHSTIVDIKEETMTAREIFEEIINAAWRNGEPGCVFLDRVNETNPLPGLGRIEACNPCGEQFLHDGDVCNLGSINLEKFVKDGKIDFERLKQVTRLAVRMLDNVIDQTEFPVERVNKVFRKNRRVGLGIMGFADMLYLLGIPYNSEEGFKTAEKVMKTINEEAHLMSQELAKEKGEFPNWDKSIYKKKGIKMRNAALTTIAPTGTISMIMDVSGGVEPYFALAYYYKGILGGDTELYYVNKHLKKALIDANCYNDEIMKRIIEEGTLQNIKEIPEKIRKVFVTAMDISPEDHIRMQASFQKHVDNSISKTCNFPNNATKEDVLQGYLLAWKLKCKGCTVYRDGSREEQVLNIKKSEKVEKSPKIRHSEDEINGSVTKTEVMQTKICPECKKEVIVSEGCYTCPSCGSSACSL